MRDVTLAKGVGMCIAFEKIVLAFLEQKDVSETGCDISWLLRQNFI